MQVEAMSVVLRPRSMWEGCDLGIRLLQSRLGWVFPCYLAVALPVFLVCYAMVGIAAWLPLLLIWILKPWLDRSILFTLSRALFAVPTAPADVWDARRDVWGAQFVATLTLRRLSASRSLTQPIRQLEGLSGAELRTRVRQLSLRHRGVARMMTVAFCAAEFAVFSSLLSLEVWLTPSDGTFQWNEFLLHPAAGPVFLTTLAYAAAVAFLEPFYVAAGFGMYLNRRVELEAWDIEQEFRRAFTA
jgi:hypothetical protein